MSAGDAAALMKRHVDTHFECDCVPNLGPTHCHGCSEVQGHPVEWRDRDCAAAIRTQFAKEGK